MWKQPLFKIFWTPEDIDALDTIIRSGMNWATGPEIRQFEEMIAEYVGSKYALTFNSGTSALHALLSACGVGQGDEVIVPSFTFIATANAPLFVGAAPVFADIEETTFGLDPDDVLEKITPHTKAIMPIHYGGFPCKIRELKEIAEDHNLLLIEDAAESFGAKVGHRNVGTFGDAAMFSYCQNKIITTGEGGSIVTDSRDIFERLKLFRSHGRPDASDYFTSTKVFDYITLGYNFRMSNVLAVLGMSQLKNVDRIIAKRRAAAQYYGKVLSRIPGLGIPKAPSDTFSVYQLYSIRTKKRNGLMRFLADRGIMSKIYFPPVHMTNFYRRVLKYRCTLPVTMKVSRDIISLPFYPTIKRKEQDIVATTIQGYYSGE